MHHIEINEIAAFVDISLYNFSNAHSRVGNLAVTGTNRIGVAGPQVPVIIIIIIILLKQDYLIQLANNKLQMAWLTSWLVVG